MTSHLFKLIWNRKGANVLIVLEIFVCFLVVFALAVTGFHMAAAYGRPLGYDWRDVWKVEVNRNTMDLPSAADLQTWESLLEAARSFPEVTAAGAIASPPYGHSTSTHGWDRDGRRVFTEVSYVTPGIKDVLRIETVSGRWFERGDEERDWTPVVVDRRLASTIAEPGEELRLDPPPMLNETQRIVGIVDSFRKGGELSEGEPYTLIFASLQSPGSPPPLQALLLRVAPGTPAAFEETLLDRLQQVARGWSFTSGRLEADRALYLKFMLLPLAAVGVMALFLLFMVILGLTGVMWQNVTRRTREFGLRRAAGARRAVICLQIVGEVAVTSGLGILAGAAVAVQVPLIGPLAFLGWSATIPALLAAAGVILLLSAISGFYPGWSATRIQPAEALHYE